MTRDEYKALQRLCRMACERQDKERGKGAIAARKSSSALVDLLYEAHGIKVGSTVWGASYGSKCREYKWTNWRRRERFRVLKVECYLRRAGNEAVPF